MGVKTRHAAALALVGWYLMLPPTDGPGLFGVNPDAPIARWEIQTGFDTARECEHEKGADLNYRLVVHSKPELKHMADVMDGNVPPKDKVESDLAQMFDREVFEKCVASDDPRLKEK